MLDRAKKLQAELATHRALAAKGQQGQVYQSRARQLMPLAEALARARQNWEAARAAGLAAGDPIPTPGLKAHAQDLLTRFRSDPNVLAEPDETFRFEFLPGLKKAAEEYESRSADAWAAHMATKAQFPVDAVLRALEAIPAYRSSVQRIREAAGEVHKLRASVPAAAELARSLALLASAVRKKDDALAAIRGDDLPDEVQAFLRKTGQGGAEISDLTPRVLSWLTTRGLTSAFRIMPSRS